jgi:hypothetical protein
MRTAWVILLALAPFFAGINPFQSSSAAGAVMDHRIMEIPEVEQHL